MLRKKGEVRAYGASRLVVGSPKRPFRGLATYGARLGGGIAGLFGQRRQCRLRGKVNTGQVIIPCISIPHFLS